MLNLISLKNCEENISWDDYFMDLANITAMRSKDPSRKVGACIVKDNKIVGLGYNGFIDIENNDDIFPWNKEGDPINTKYPYVIHAEMNAIINSTSSVKDCIIYVTTFPCAECAKFIAQSKIKEVVYMEEYDSTSNKDGSIIARKIFDLCGIKVRQYE